MITTMNIPYYDIMYTYYVCPIAVIEKTYYKDSY